MDIKVNEDLWSLRMLPEGLLESWLAPDGSHVKMGDLIASVRIEDAVHDIIAPVAGRLTILTATGGLIEPGSILGRLGSTV